MARKGHGTAAKLSYACHLLMEHRNALIVDAELSEATGYAERDTPLEMLTRLPATKRRRPVAELRDMNITPHRTPHGTAPPSTGAPPATKAIERVNGSANGSRNPPTLGRTMSACDTSYTAPMPVGDLGGRRVTTSTALCDTRAPRITHATILVGQDTRKPVFALRLWSAARAWHRNHAPGTVLRMTTNSPFVDGPSTAIGPPPPLDTECAAVLASLGETVGQSMTPDMIPVMRSLMPRLTADDLRRGDVFSVEERHVPGPRGAPEISLLICRSNSAAAPVAAIYHVHGGGMVLGDNRSGISDVLDWAQDLGLAVVSAEYRLAPETRHPGPVEDCYAGLVWLVAHAVDLMIDPARIVIVGTSAGGGLAGAVALLARDRHGPALAGQMLRFPMLDDRNNTASAYQMTGIGVWDRSSNETGWKALLGEDQGGLDVSAYAAPRGPETCPGCRRRSSMLARPRSSEMRP